VEWSWPISVVVDVFITACIRGENEFAPGGRRAGHGDYSTGRLSGHWPPCHVLCLSVGQQDTRALQRYYSPIQHAAPLPFAISVGTMAAEKCYSRNFKPCKIGTFAVSTKAFSNLFSPWLHQHGAHQELYSVDWPSDLIILFGPIPWGHSSPLCQALSSSSWTSMRRRRATVAAVATPGEWQCKMARSSEWAQHFSNASCLSKHFYCQCIANLSLIWYSIHLLCRLE